MPHRDIYGEARSDGYAPEKFHIAQDSQSIVALFLGEQGGYRIRLVSENEWDYSQFQIRLSRTDGLAASSAVGRHTGFIRKGRFIRSEITGAIPEGLFDPDFTSAPAKQENSGGARISAVLGSPTSEGIFEFGPLENPKEVVVTVLFPEGFAFFEASLPAEISSEIQEMVVDVPTERCSIRGVVVNEVGEPLEKAMVWLKIPGNPELEYSDENGEFSFEGFVAGSGLIAIRAIGFVTLTTEPFQFSKESSEIYTLTRAHKFAASARVVCGSPVFIQSFSLVDEEGNIFHEGQFFVEYPRPGVYEAQFHCLGREYSESLALSGSEEPFELVIDDCSCIFLTNLAAAEVPDEMELYPRWVTENGDIFGLAASSREGHLHLEEFHLAVPSGAGEFQLRIREEDGSK